MNKEIRAKHNPFRNSCMLTREFCSQKSISFIEKGVVNHPSNLEERVQKTGGKGMPTLMIDEKVIVEIDKLEIAKTL